MNDIEIIFILVILFISVKGLENSGLLYRLSRRIENGSFIALKLVIITFFFSMIVTNDVALLVLIPLTLTIDTNRKDLLIILEALSANAGSALTPFGNPQNLFIYWYYNIEPVKFIAEIAPFTLLFLVLFATVSFFLKTSNGKAINRKPERINFKAYIYVALLLLVILTVLHIVPVQAGIVIIIYAILFDRKSLRIDYILLLTLISFLGISENLKVIFSSHLEHAGHIFILSALTSQIISNVPSALVFAKFTTQWKALLWGTNVGGFGGLLGSLANLIAYRLYTSNENTDNPTAFTFKFIAIGYAAFIVGIGLYFMLG